MVLLAVVVVGVGLLLLTGRLPYTAYIIHTGSMGEAVPTKSLAIVHRGQYEVGQPVTFVANGEVITHRLVAIAADGIITTKGDANRSVDPWHPPASNIIGGVVAAPHELGLIVYAIGRPMTLVGLLLMFVGVYLWPSQRKTDLSPPASSA